MIPYDAEFADMKRSIDWHNEEKKKVLGEKQWSVMDLLMKQVHEMAKKASNNSTDRVLKPYLGDLSKKPPSPRLRLERYRFEKKDKYDLANVAAESRKKKGILLIK